MSAPLCSGTHETIFIVGEIESGWKLHRPLPLRVERDEDGSYLVSDDQWAVYGEGADRRAAIEDYRRSLIEYRELIEEEAQDHAPTRGLFERICGFVAKVESCRSIRAR